ncbi:probable L-type lectin-domain containing receptor kinase S.5 [Arachis stenosperma]|uniref:probable L-type lectin-domain containing receptor kinase S.5 n=1 Tax=Arachis stenosperma TaxID=217475 RepID=UPI0025ACDA28|nr:probable L-type lectin-domain containing receptor kinase S.5 [Arachis stenosperma]
MAPPPWLSLSGATTAIPILPLFIMLKAVTSQDQLIFGPSNSTKEISNIIYPIPVAWINYSSGGSLSLQLTPYSSGNIPVGQLANKSGGIFFARSFNLWRNASKGRVASFNTSFLFSMVRVNNVTPAGEGMAFVIAPSYSVPIPPNSYGQYLGLTNNLTDGDPSNQIVAIEFDTVKQDFDPDDNHVGLDINSVRSNLTVSLSQFGFQIAPSNNNDSGSLYVVWVEYDGVKKVIDVYMAKQPHKDGPLVEKPLKAVLSSNLDLAGLVNQNSYFGFSASSGSFFYEENAILRWNLSVEDFGSSSLSAGGETHLAMIGTLLGLESVLFILLVVCVVLSVGYVRKKIRISESELILLRVLRRLPGTPREFSFRELKEATDNFDEKLKLGKGGYGVVYKGTLPRENTELAVKKFSRDSVKEIDDFLAELTIINRLRHRNLVQLLGWCHKKGVLLLVYDYMPNGSLDRHIFYNDGSNQTPLSWQLRYKIILGVVSALHYLHNEYDQIVVHRDLKASNIMLDSDFNARLGDFGLARAIENERTSYAELEGVAGTRGYIAPECLHTGKATRDSDVYGLGAVLLEVVCGERAWARIEGYNLLVDWVWYLYREGRLLDAVDPRLGNNYVGEEVEMMLKLGLACSHPIANERPKMQEILQIISGLMPVPHVPPFKPPFVWPVLNNNTLTPPTIDYTPINTAFFAR